MSILKRKIRIVPTYHDEDYFEIKLEEPSNFRQETLYDCSKKATIDIKSSRKRQPPKIVSPTKKDAKPSKVIPGTKVVRNYAKALCSFASSAIAIPYIQKLLEQDIEAKTIIEDFQNYIAQKKDKTISIVSLRGLLMITGKDSPIEKLYKEIFMETSVVFIKFFSVNWIFSGKVKYRLEHMKYRHKMLRRVRNPELFTFLKKR